MWFGTRRIVTETPPAPRFIQGFDLMFPAFSGCISMWCFDTGYNKNETNEAAVADICKLRCVQVVGFVWKPPVVAAAPLVLGEERCSDFCSPVVNCCVTPVGYRGAHGLWMQDVTSAFALRKGSLGLYVSSKDFCCHSVLTLLCGGCAANWRTALPGGTQCSCACIRAGALHTSWSQRCCRAGWLFWTRCSAI